MAHIHTKPGQHDHTASALIFRLDFKEPKLILHKHKILGKYLQFGGHIELDETPWQTIVREIREEAGYDIDQLKILQPVPRLKQLTDTKLHPHPLGVDTHKFTDDHSHIDIKYVFVTNKKPKHKIGNNESSDIRLFSRSEINKLTEDDTFINIIEHANFVFDHVLNTWQPIDPTIYVL